MLLAGAAAWMAEVQHDPFFWDAVQLGSKHAHYFYERGLRWEPLPTAIDSGHPPVLGYYLAWVWQLAGKTLPISHWAIFPFIAAAVVLLFRMGVRLGGSALWGVGLVLLVAADPVVAAQSGIVGPDIVLLFFFLLAVEGFWVRRWPWAMMGILGLCAVSLRGMMTAAGLLAWQVYVQWPALKRDGKRTVTWMGTFVPGFVFAGWFLLWHQQAVGWTGFHPASPWATAFQPVHGTGVLRNAAVLAWRWADFGRIFEWVGLAMLTVGLPKRQAIFPWGALLLAMALFLSPSALFFQNLSAHRYFLPGFAALHLLFWYCLHQSPLATVRKYALFALVGVGLLTGNRWIYPHGIAMGWDATLAHRPYHTLRAEAMQAIEKAGVPLERIGTAFPNRNTGEDVLLNGDRRQWAEFEPKTNDYVLISNVFNDVSPEDRHYLQQNRRLLWRRERAGVWIEWYGY